MKKENNNEILRTKHNLNKIIGYRKIFLKIIKKCLKRFSYPWMCLMQKQNSNEKRSNKQYNEQWKRLIIFGRIHKNNELNTDKHMFARAPTCF